VYYFADGASVIELLCAFVALQSGPDDLIVLTHGGRKLAGRVTQDGAFTRVDTPLGPERLPTKDVAAVFRSPAEAAEQAQGRFRTAKAAYAQAETMDVANPLRNEKLQLAIEQAQAAAAVYRALETHFGSDASLQIPKNVQVLQQFIRLCRGSSTSDLAGAPASRGPLLPLVAAEFKAPTADDALERPWELSTPLAPGLADRARDLENPDPERRIEAARALLHPPSAEHQAALLKLLEVERDPAVVRVLGGGLGLLDAGSLLKSLGWAKKAEAGPKQGIVMGLARTSGDRAAFDFVASWFVESPPDRNEERALFAGAFRQFQAWSVPWLKELLTKHRQPKLQIEILRQMGVVGDKTFGTLLVKALPAYGREASVALQKIGKPVVPFLMEGTKSNDPDQRQACLGLLRRITGVNGINMSHFEKWWDENRKAVLEQDAARQDDPVTPADFNGFEGR
jgi:hypothetical protein